MVDGRSSELGQATPERLYRAARRTLGDTSDAVWCDNNDDIHADARLLARFYLREMENHYGEAHDEE